MNERNLSRNTRLSYRDTLVSTNGFLTRKLHHSPEKLTVVDVSPDLVQSSAGLGKNPAIVHPHPQSASGSDPFARPLHRDA